MKPTLTRLIITAVIITFLVLLSAGQQQPAGTDRDFFPVAVWYAGGKSRAPMLSRDPQRERAQWLRDLQAIKATGFNTVKTWVDWATAEPVEGQFNFADLQQLLDLAQQTGLRVIVQAYADSAPDWVGKKFPDAQFVTSTGVKIQSQAAPGFCFDHPGVHAEVLRFYRELARVANASPAFYGYDLWSEPHIVNWVWFNDLPNVKFCYCPYTRARFRAWLRRKYGSLQAVNASWYRTFQNWSEVDQQRFGTILSYADFMDWEAFIPNKLAEDLGAKAAAVRQSDPTHVTSSHSDVPAVLTTPFSDYGMPDDWQMFRRVDYYGTSIYPKHASARLHGWDPTRRAFAFDGAYSASRRKGFFVGELQAGQGATGLEVNDPIEPTDIDDWAWSLVSHGAKAICFYAWYPMNAGYESNGYGFINLDGTITDRAREGGRIAQVITNNSALFKAAQPQRASIAILYNPISYMSGGDTVGPGTAVRDSMLGVYRALWQKNIPVEFIHADDAERGGLMRYKAVYLPYAITLARATSRAIADYVRNGGIAIAEARLAWNDERGFANERIPGAGLDEVFGVREASLWPGTKTSLHFNEDAPKAMRDTSAPAAQFEEALAVDRGTVLARFDDGQPAVVTSTFGRGRTMFIGTFLGMSAERGGGENAAKEESRAGSPEALRVIQGLADWAGVSAPVAVQGSDVEARLLNANGATLLIAINRGSAQTVNVQMDVSARSARDVISGRAVQIKSNGGRTGVALMLPHEGVGVLELR